MAKQKISPFFSVLIIMALIFSLIPNVKSAVGTPQASNLTGFTTNQNVNVVVSGYSIFATDKKIFFYNQSTAQLLKQWNLPYTSNLNIQKTSILALNSSHVLITSAWLQLITSWDYIQAYSCYLNINTLNYTQIFYDVINWCTIDPTYYSFLDSVSIQLTNNYYFLVGTSKKYSGYYSRMYKIYPSYSAIGYSDSILLNGSSIYIPSKTVSTECYVLTTKTNFGADKGKALIYKLIPSTFTVTSIGESPLGLIYGIYVYLVDFVYHQIGDNYYYDVFYYHSNTDDNKKIGEVILRFNATYINQYFSYTDLDRNSEGYNGNTWDNGALSNILRPLSVQLPVNTYGNGTLTNGYYKFLYVGEYNVIPYVNPFCIFSNWIADLETTTPHIYNYDSETNWFPNGISPQSFYFGLSTNVGGYFNPFTRVLIELDYTGNYCISDIVNSLNAQFSYLFDLFPTPITKTTQYYELYLSQQYTYYGYVFNNGIQAGNGTFTVNSTGIGLSSSIATLGTYTQVTNGLIINGILKFYYAPRTGTTTIYEGIKIKITLSSLIYTKQDLIEWIPKEGVPNPSGGNMGYGGFDLTWWLIIFLCIFLPATVLGLYLGISGFMGGLVLSIGIGISTGLLPFWLITFVGLAIFIIFIMWKR